MFKSICVLCLYITTICFLGSCSKRPSAEIIQVEGNYYLNDGQRVFQPLAGHEIFWVEGKKKSLQILHDFYLKQRITSFDKCIGVKLAVTNMGHQYEGDASFYEETLYIQKILQVSPCYHARYTETGVNKKSS